MVDYKIHWLKMMSVPESRAVVGRHDGINGRDIAAIAWRTFLTNHADLQKSHAPCSAEKQESSDGAAVPEPLIKSDNFVAKSWSAVRYNLPVLRP